jgi:fructokinase
MAFNHNPIFGAIEAGGTKFVLAVGDNQSGIIAQTSIPTTTPGETLQKAIDWFQGQGPIAALGIACFGPVDLNPASPTWGYITQTTKPDWSHTNVAGFLGDALNCPVGFDTDVNGAALGEYLYGTAKGRDVAIYVTIGTGIGGGAVVGGKTVKGAYHPEMGHILPRRHAEDAKFPGHCAFHGDCLEGLASGPAIKARWGASLSELAQDHPAHDIVADYLAQFCQTMMAVYSPQCIILGGGVMQTPGLIDRIKQRTTKLAGDYFGPNPADIIVPPALGNLSGITGAFELACRAVAESVK